MSDAEACCEQPRPAHLHSRRAARRTPIGSGLLAILILLAPYAVSPVLSQTWTGETSSDWFDATNWSTSAVPTDSDFVHIDTTSPNATVISDQTTNGSAEAQDLIVGNSSTGSLTIENGGELALSDAIAIGFNSGSKGTVVVTGSSILNSAGGLIVGSEGTATLTISEGGEVILQDIAGPIVLADGIEAKASIIIGSAVGQDPVAPGTITAQGISIIEPGGTLVFNHTATSTDAYEFSTPIAGLSAAQNGAISVTAGYTVFTGDNSGFTGSTTIDGGTLVVEVALRSSDLIVGDSGTDAALLVDSGGQVTATGDATIGNDSGSSGTATVTGSGSSASALSIAGDLTVGNKGTGTLTVSSGASVDISSGDGTISVAKEGGSTGTVIIGAASGASAVAPGSLSAASLAFGSGTGTLTLNHTGTESDETEFAFAITGNGAIDVEAGYTELSADNSGFSGTTTVDVGTLALTGNLKGSALNVGTTGTGGTMTITNSAVVDIGADAAIGVASGSSGTVTISGATSDGTTTDASTLKVSKDLVVGAAGTGTLILNNAGAVLVDGGMGALTIAQSAGSKGTLIIGSQTGDTPLGTGDLSVSKVAFGDGSGTVLFNHADDSGGFEFAIPLTGTGTIDVEDGTTVLSSNNTSFTGGTEINGGALSVTGTLPGDVTVNDGGTLGGTGTLTGTVTVKSGGTVSPGSSTGTLNTADVTFESGSIFSVEIDSGGDVDLLDSGGTVTIDGGTVLISADSYAVDTTFTIASADTAVDGAFSSVSGTSAFIDYTLSYDATDVLLSQSVSQSFQSVGATKNQLAVGVALDSMPIGHEVVQSTFGATTETEAQVMFDMLSGEVHASLQGALMTGGRKIVDAVNRRLGATFPEATEVFAYGGGDNADAQNGAWIAGYGGWEDVDATASTAAADNSFGGVVAGIDREVGRHWRLGVFGAYGHTETTQSARSSSANADSFSAGAYGSATHGALFVNLGGLATWHDIDSSRTVTIRRSDQTLTAGYDATSWQIFSEAGYRIDRGDTRIEPFANLSFMQLKTDGYSETGGSAALTAMSDTESTTFTTIGLRLGQRLTEKLRMHGMAGWRHAFGDIDPTATFTLAGSIPFTATGAPIAENALVVEAGFEVEVSDNLSLGAGYDGQFGDGSTANQFEGHLQLRF